MCPLRGECDRVTPGVAPGCGGRRDRGGIALVHGPDRVVVVHARDAEAVGGRRGAVQEPRSVVRPLDGHRGEDVVVPVGDVDAQVGRLTVVQDDVRGRRAEPNRERIRRRLQMHGQRGGDAGIDGAQLRPEAAGLAGTVDRQTLRAGVTLQMEVDDAADTRYLVEVRTAGDPRGIGCIQDEARRLREDDPAPLDDPARRLRRCVDQAAILPSTVVCVSSIWFDQSSVSNLANAQNVSGIVTLRLASSPTTAIGIANQSVRLSTCALHFVM